MNKMDIFLNRMETYLSKEDFVRFKSSFNSDVQKSIRINPLKISVEDFKKISPFTMREANVSPYHFYIDDEISGNHPYHLAGLYYMQECSAGSAVEAMHVQEGDIVLDMCAAPGGKSTQIAAKLMNTGLLVSNEYVVNRAQILLSNIERMGPRNVIITNEHPTKIGDTFPNFFTKVLVDAPCSGEGMFHKDEKALEDWSMEHVDSCATRQLEIINDAYRALAGGGEMVYSTCTFSKEENELLIVNFLKEHPDMEIIDADLQIGRPAFKIDEYETDKAVRIYPMDGGDGHFVCRMRKSGTTRISLKEQSGSKLSKEMIAFLDSQLASYDIRKFYTVNDKLYYFEGPIYDTKKVKIVRYGVLVGEQVKNVFKPHHHFFMAFNKDLKHHVHLDTDTELLHLYLLGNEIHFEMEYNGFVSVCVKDYTVGFGKISNNQIKNHYPKGLRLLK